MSTEELKIGDRVEVLNDAHPAIKPGDVVEVVRFDEDRCGYANRTRVKFVKGKPKAGEGLEDHPFPWLSSVEWRKVSSNKTIGSPQETLIRFMYAKQAKLGPEVNYFTFRDAEAIAAWPTIECKRIIEKMFEESKSDHTLVGPDACPFCWKHDECKTCEWGRNHGMCKDEESDYHRASRKTEIKNLELNGLIDILGSHSSEPSEPEKPKMSRLKIWENRSEDDPDDQIYLHLTENPDPYIRLVLVDYNGDEVESPTLLIFDLVAGNVIAPVGANPKFKKLMETTDQGEIKIR